MVDRGDMSRRGFAAMLVGAAAAPIASSPDARATSGGSGHAMRRAAAQMMAGMRPGGRERLAFPFPAPERYRWTYVPGPRAGVTLAQMSAAERDLAMALLGASLSRTGYDKATGVMKLAAVLQQTRGWGGGSDAYAFAVFGDPAAGGPWGWRVEGHHLSLNFTAIDDQILSATPHCVCADPMEVREGEFAGIAPIHREDYIGRDLVRNLDVIQLSRTRLTGGVPNDVRAGPGRAENGARDGGIAYSELTDETQRHLMLGIAETYISNLPHDLAHPHMARIADAGLDALRFEWSGGFETNDLHYYRLHCPTLVVEYATREAASHVHTLWREPGNDFGRAKLAAAGQEALPPQSA
jgi:hypothetical protein